MPRPVVKPRTAAKYQTSWKNSGGNSSPPWKEWRFGIKPGARGKKYYTVQDVTIGDFTLNMKAVYNVTQKEALFFATGLRLWPSARILSMYLAAHPEVLTAADAIVELGSGPGLAGIAASKLCGRPSKVFMTDHNENVLELLQENIESNFGEGEDRPTCEFLDWCTGVERFKKRYGTFDVVLGADIVYSERTIMPMLSTVRALLAEKPSSVFLLVYVGRLKVYDEMFRECSTECQLHCTEVALDSIPGAADIQDDNAMLHKIRVIVVRHKEFMDRSLDLLVAQTLEGVQTLEVEDTADNKLAQQGAEVENPDLNDGVAEESTKYDIFPIADNISKPQSSGPKEPPATSDGHDEYSTIIDGTTGRQPDCRVIVPLKHIAAEALVDLAEETLPAQPNSGEVMHSFSTVSVGGNSQAESITKKENDLSVLPKTDEAPAMMASAGCHEAAGKDIPMKSLTKADIPVISTVEAVCEAEGKPPIVKGALTADEPPSIQVTSTENVVGLLSNLETEKTAVGSVVEGSDKIVDDFEPKPGEPSPNDEVICSSRESTSNSGDTIDAEAVADMLDDLLNEAVLAVGICTGQPSVSITETVRCAAPNRVDAKFNQEEESASITKSENDRQSNDITLTKSEPLGENVSEVESEVSLFTASKSLDSTQNDGRNLVQSNKSCSDFGGEDEINYHVNNCNNETRFDTDKKVSVDNIADEQLQTVPGDGVNGEDETSIIKREDRQYSSEEGSSNDSHEESFERDSVTSDSSDEHIDGSINEVTDSRSDKLDNYKNAREKKATVETSQELETKTRYQSFSASDSNMSLYSAMMHLVLIPTFVSVVMFLVSLLAASIWFQIFFNT
ncbi:uro-adherence factor A-like isoform X2 [Branchiostoma lanceolatum]|uniref:uro-adherence factor A-like isoform X2 n=1 Tax=Branchiostoma lanceolatum TaxID=7740 RepID=UPI003453FCD6